MIHNHRTRCILFDLGSTLWTRWEEGVLQAKRQSYQRAGTILRHSSGDQAFASMDALELGLLVHKTVEKRIHHEKRQKPGYEPDFALVTTQALRRVGLAQADRGLGETIFEALRIRIPVSRILFADTLSTLEALRQRGYILGVVTNRDYGGAPFREDLHVMGLLDYFEYQHMAISADLGIRKPHPDIFKYALNGLHVSPEETAMVGDNLKADIAGAKELNMLAVWKPKSSQQHEQALLAQVDIQPDLTIEHLSDLLEVF